MRWWMAAGLVLATGCVEPDDDSGTSVGNPNLTLVKIAPGGLGIQITAASLPFKAVRVSNSNRSVDVDLPDTTDVLAGAPLDLPNGDWTELAVVLDGRLDVDGLDIDATIDLELDVTEVAVRSQRSPLQTGEPHVFELAFPGWLEADNAGWVAGEEHIVRPGDPEHDTLAGFVEQNSAYLPDADGDGDPDR